ncbi:hypothetical protein M9Y10_013084 [Tritrichomonas musculus]|uniref:Uncharacterized protein n=1 Tax=Tritrichomonas musculus TaxID=1915356 RepID=A0ABR2I638_9EUKA
MRHFHKFLTSIEYFVIISLILFLTFFKTIKSTIGISLNLIRSAGGLPDKNTLIESQKFPGYDAYRYCIPKKRQKTYSSSKDLCITPIFNFENNFALNLFSIRKSGCAATIVILSDDTTSFSQDTENLISLFKVKICKGIFKGESMLKRHVDFMRDTLCYELLKFIYRKMKENVASYDRVFFFDSFDVYFEKDPFRYFEKKDVVYFFQEADVKLADSSFNADGVSGCFGIDGLESIKDKPVICSGTMGAGSVASFLKFLKYFVHLKCFQDSRCPYDQGALIYVIHANLLKKKKINYFVFPPDGPVAACKIGPINIVNKKTKKGKEYLQIYSLNNNHKYEVVHQYTSIQQILDGFTEKTHFNEYIKDHKDEIQNNEANTIILSIS